MYKFVSGISVFALAAAGAFAQSAAVPAVVTDTTPMIGVAEGQTARLNVLNPSVAAPALGVVCSATLSFLDSTGKVLKSSVVSVKPGTASPFDLSADADLALMVDQRRDIRATVAIPAFPPNVTSSTAAQASCTLIGTLEIFNTLDGRTQVSVGATHPIPNVVATPSPAN